MPVYPVAAGSATSCASPGCWCRDRRPCYPSDLTGAQWEVLEPRAREVMRDLTIAAGRPMVHDLRAMCDAVSYVVKNGVEWRALPVDFLSVTWNQTPQNPSRILRRHHELRRTVGHEGAGGEVAGSGPA